MPNSESEKDIFNPGQSDQLISPSEAIKRDPGFFDNRPPGVEWTLSVRRPDGTIEKFGPECAWRADSKFGSVSSAIVTDVAGKPQFARPRYNEADNINAIVWGINKETDEVELAMVSQPRPHADDPADPESTKTVVFSQIPMGFMASVVGNDHIKAYNTYREAAVGKTQEKVGGVVIIKDITEPENPEHNPNPTFVGTWSHLVFAEVDLEAVKKLNGTRKESIFRAEYIPLPELMKDIRRGTSGRGLGSTRMCTSNSLILTFLSYKDELVAKSKARDQQSAT